MLRPVAPSPTLHFVLARIVALLAAVRLGQQCGLTLRSSGRTTACHAWPSFHSGPCASCRGAPLSSNVSPHTNAVLGDRGVGVVSRCTVVPALRHVRLRRSPGWCAPFASSLNWTRPFRERRRVNRRTAHDTRVRASCLRGDRQLPTVPQSVSGSRFARQCCAWQSVRCDPWRLAGRAWLQQRWHTARMRQWSSA